LPLRHEDTKTHKELILNGIPFVTLRAFVPSRQKMITLLRGLNYLFDNICFFCNIDNSELTSKGASVQIVGVKK
jgi:hypothetical protein